jgi:thioredoxin reductase (NADPH)
VTIFGRTGSANAYAIRDFLYRSDVPFEWVKIKDDEQARQLGPAERP